MFCSNCGSPVQEGQAVCLNCGFSLRPSAKSKGDGWFDTPSNNGSKRGVVAIITWFFGVFGVHRFMMGDKKIGTIQLLITLSSIFLIFPLIVTAIWALVDFIKIVSADEEEFSVLFAE